MAQGFTLDDLRRQLGQNLVRDMKDLAGGTEQIFARMPDASEEDLVLALGRLHQMMAELTDDERRALDRLPRLVAAMRGEERRMLQFIWQSVRSRQIIEAMTEEERSNPDLIDGSRLTHIANRSGTRPEEVEQLLAVFLRLRQFVSMSLWQRLKLVLGLAKPLEDADLQRFRPKS